MKRLLMILAAVAAFNLPAGTGATTNWVAQFVREYVGNALSNSTASIAADAQDVTETNGVETTVMEAGGYTFTINFEPLDQPALKAGDCGAAAATFGITNGFLWAWSDQGVRYINTATDPIIPTPTNFTFRGVCSVEIDKKTYLRNASGANICSLTFTNIQKSKADELKGAN